MIDCTATAPAACTETYLDVQKMIFKVAHTYSHRNGLPFDEVLSAAHFVFMRAFHYRYRPKGKPASFSTRLYNSLNWELRDFLKKESKHQGHLEINEEIVGAQEYDANFRVMLDTEQLSEDAKAIVALVLDRSEELTPLLRWQNVQGKKGYLAALEEHLSDLGWTVDRVQESFAELRFLFSK